MYIHCQKNAVRQKRWPEKEIVAVRTIRGLTGCLLEDERCFDPPRLCGNDVGYLFKALRVDLNWCIKLLLPRRIIKLQIRHL